MENWLKIRDAGLAIFHRSCLHATWLADNATDCQRRELQSENPIRTLGKFETRARRRQQQTLITVINPV